MLRELMIKRIEYHGGFDYCFERGDDNAKAFKTYAKWLESLSDDDFLDAYDRTREAYIDYCNNDA